LAFICPIKSAAAAFSWSTLFGAKVFIEFKKLPGFSVKCPSICNILSRAPTTAVFMPLFNPGTGFTAILYKPILFF